LAAFVSVTVSNSDTRLYLPWLTCAALHRWDNFYFSHLAKASKEGDFASRYCGHYHTKLRQCKYGL